MAEVLYITVKEILAATGKAPATLRRWMRRKGIRTEGHSVSLGELQSKWPEFYKTLRLVQSTPPCPRCTSEMVCQCAECGFTVNPSAH